LQTSETEVDFVNIEREKGMKRKQNGFADLYQWAEQQDDYWLEGVKIEFTEQMLAQMDALSISRKDLAQRLGVSPAYITKILRGSTNFTLKSMVGIARALN
jgi:transcriptional regulator with XRE-family HTH domain